MLSCALQGRHVYSAHTPHPPLAPALLPTFPAEDSAVHRRTLEAWWMEGPGYISRLDCLFKLKKNVIYSFSNLYQGRSHPKGKAMLPCARSMTWEGRWLLILFKCCLFFSHFAPLNQNQLRCLISFLSSPLFFPFFLPNNMKEKCGLFFLVDACSKEYKTLVNV